MFILGKHLRDLDIGLWIHLGKRFHVKFLGYAHCFMPIWISPLKYYSISVDQSRYATYVVSKYIDTSTVQENSKLHNTTLPHDTTLTK